jgi:hypothetical protein
MLDCRRREIGKAVEDVASNSMTRAIEKEMELKNK